MFHQDGVKTYEQSKPENTINIKPACHTIGWYQGADRFPV
jgi:hypothetical protein